MKKTGIILCAALLCALLLNACGSQNQKAPEAPTVPPGSEQAPIPDKQDALPVESEEQPISIDHLTVELVVEWEEGDRLLSQLDSLSQLLKESLLAQNYQVDEVTITISTAGGFTADALNNGGVDLAFLPAVDYITCSDTVCAVLTTDEDVCRTVVAVNGMLETLDEKFCAALTAAMLDTEPGTTFLNTYQPDITCVPATETAIQTVRDWVSEQESEGGN